MRKVFLFLLLLGLPTAVMAGVLTPPPTDKSVQLLGSIFGTHIGSQELLGGIPNPALTHMFELFNVVVITLGGLIISYIVTVSTINTAQDGQAMGRKWSSVWIILRSTIGMGMVVPHPTQGHSVVQSIVVWLILQGVGAADEIWNSVLNDLSQGMAANAGIQRPQEEHTDYTELDNNGTILTNDLLRSAVCMHAVHDISKRYQGGNSAQRHSGVAKFGRLVGLYLHGGSPAMVGADRASVSGTFYIGTDNPKATGFGNICGQYDIRVIVDRNEWDDPARVSDTMLLSKTREIYAAKVSAITTMYNTLSIVANEIVNGGIVEPRDHHGRLRIAEPHEQMDKGGYRLASVNAYVHVLSGLVKPQRQESVQEIVRKGRQNGWISAGSFYFVLNLPVEHQFFDSVKAPIIASNIPICDDAAHCLGHYPETGLYLNHNIRDFIAGEHTYIANRLWDAGIYLENDNISIDESIVAELNRQPGAKESQLQADLNRLFTKLMSEQATDPLIAQGKFGAQLMQESEEMWMEPLQRQQALLNRAAQESGVLSDAISNLLKDATLQGNLGLEIYKIIWIIGATLAIYVPLVPYMMFTVAVLGWFLLVIEAVVAAPLMAISLILPSGDELGKVVQGLMLLLNIILRPTLMLFGFVLAARLYGAIVHLVNFSMLGNFASVNMDTSLYACVAIICLYGAFIVALANKCFSLIYALPDKILRWMGGAPEHTDASQEIQQARGVMSKGADTVNKISTGFAERGYAKMQGRGSQLDQPNSGGKPGKPE